MVEAAPESRRLLADLQAHAKPLWPGGDVAVPHAELGRDLASTLKTAYRSRRIVRGFEEISRALNADARGLKQVDDSTGVERGKRVSRLLVMSDDGAQRFYRNAESLLRKHAPRVLALRLAADQQRLGQAIFGPDQVARLAMVEHKDAVSEVLLALAAQWNRERRRT